MAEEPGWQIFGLPIRGRSCGSCHACCTHVPVELATRHKPAGIKCTHLRAGGCGIYADRPSGCAAWNCRWLFDPGVVEAGLRRPDLAGYIIDPMLCTIMANGEPLDVAQIWADPKRPLAHRDPALRAYLVRLCATHGLLALVRHAIPGEGLLLIPPAKSATGEWLELDAPLVSDAQVTRNPAYRPSQMRLTATLGR